MKILQIMCHPDYNGEHRVSNILAKIGEEKLVEKGFSSVEKINLYDPSVHIPVMDKFMFNYEEEKLTEKEQHDKIRQKEILNQWKSTDAVFIYMPLHNFNVVSKFKDYIDNIVIVNETFKCEVESLIGLDDSDKQITFVITSGGEFDKHIQYTNLDFAVQYVRGIFGVLGIDKIKVLRVEGLDLAFNDKEQIVKKAIVDLKAWIEEFSRKNKK
ncbi:NAD(P)H-dependent oxidoreductase [uncultured Gemella sp.]|uniref:NAD(P)H-dependent oxidoreductase n=1 Tax=uncultured Gemella sp. TaxID=254352 RepID=UPI0028D29B42|nr:NAD(P)H-dependent oxidoreductase [uncultured Gemella sp.]